MQIEDATKAKDGAAHRTARSAPRRLNWQLALGLLAACVAVAAVAGTVYLMPGAIESAAPGDCASYTRSDTEDPYHTVSCGSSAATFTVLQVIDGEGTCRTVAGASRSVISTESGARREVCMGDKGVDPAGAINVAQPGECLSTGANRELRVPCSDPTATSKILKRVDDVPGTDVATSCEDVPDAISVYSWTWDTDDGTGPAEASFQTDAVFCLGPVR